MFRIALDAGHGKNTPGKRCHRNIDPAQTREWVLNDRICRKIAEKLKAYDGYELRRVDDTTGAVDVSRGDRCKKANEFGADIYLSVHHNAANKIFDGGGITVFVWNKPNSELQSWQKQFYDALIAKTGLKGNRATPLAKKNFDVLVKTNMQALLFELGFMDSTTDVPIILTDKFAEQAADAFVETLVKIGGLSKKVPEEPEATSVRYRVQVGSFQYKKNADAMLEKLKKDGYSGVIVKV